MEQQIFRTDDGTVKQENVLAGAVGAFLFSLVGGVLWFLLYQMNFLAGISGIVGVVCAFKGYSLFSGRESKKGLIISVIFAVAVMCLAWYCTLSYDVYSAYQQWYADGEVEYTVSFFEAFRYGWQFLTEPEIGTEYFKDLALGLLLCGVASVSYIITAFKKIDVAKALPVPSMQEPVATLNDEPQPQEATIFDE